jgi:formylglycine-generating enzyme required for sulfatase activity
MAIGAAVLVLCLLGVVAVFFASRRQVATQLSPTLPTPAGMVLVPAGPFLFGKNLESVMLPAAFYIDETEVSNAAYQVSARRRGMPYRRAFQKASRIIRS